MASARSQIKLRNQTAGGSWAQNDVELNQRSAVQEDREPGVFLELDLPKQLNKVENRYVISMHAVHLCNTDLPVYLIRYSSHYYNCSYYARAVL